MFFWGAPIQRIKCGGSDPTVEKNSLLQYSFLMAYEVTATRRRPQTFEDLVGQEFVASTLKNSIKSGKIAHAYLFSGPRGCGKTSTARILAKVLNCEKGPDNAPCGECSACKEITKGSSLDVIEIDGASNTSVNDVRQIKDEVLFPPNSCKYKIYIIDEVHMLSTSAFNALLKTIEEPPPYVIFIFATTELHKVPATIKSRCQQFHFRLGSMDQIKDLLAKAAEEVGIKADEEALYWIARESTGSFRDAYTLFDQVAAFSDGHITYEGIRDKLGLVGSERLNAMCELCCDGNAGAALERIDELLQSGVSIEQFITNFTDYLRSMLLIQNGITKEALLGQSAERFSKKVLQCWDAVKLERAISLFLQLFRDIRYSLSPRYELELAVTKLSWLSSYVSAREVKAAIDSARSLLSSAGPVQQAPSAGAPQGSPSFAGAPHGAPQGYGQPAQPMGAQQTQQFQGFRIPGSTQNPTQTQPQNGNSRPFFESGTEKAVPQPAMGQSFQAQSAKPQFQPASTQAAAQQASPSQPQNPLQPAQFSPQAQAFSQAAGGQNSPVQQSAQFSFQPAQQPAQMPNSQPVQMTNNQPSQMQQVSSQTEDLPPQPMQYDGNIAAFKDTVLEELSVSKTMLATWLAGTDSWQINGSTLVIPVKSVFQNQQLFNERAEISKIIKNLYGMNLQISPQLIVEEKEDLNAKLPDGIQLLCKNFSGKVVSVQSNMEGEQQTQQAAAPETEANTEKKENDTVEESIFDNAQESEEEDEF